MKLLKQGILEKFKEDYNLTYEEAALATGLKTAKSYKDIANDVRRADGFFIKNFCSVSGYSEDEIFETVTTEKSINTSLINIEQNKKIEELKELQDYIIKIKPSKLFISYILAKKLPHKPVITLIGDSFSGKDTILSSFFPLIKKNTNNLPVYLFHKNDFYLNSNIQIDKPFVLTPDKNKLFEPFLAFYPEYIESCKIQDVTDNEYEDNSVLVICSNSQYLKNCIILNLPTIVYDSTHTSQLSNKTITNISLYSAYSDIIVYFDAVTRLLSISESPLIQYLLDKNKNNLLFVGTKPELISSKTLSSTPLSEKYKYIKSKDSNFSYYGNFSFQPQDVNDIPILDKQLFIFEKNGNNEKSLIMKIDNLAQEYLFFGNFDVKNIILELENQKSTDFSYLSEIQKIIDEEIGLIKEKLQKCFESAADISKLEKSLNNSSLKVNENNFSLYSFIFFYNIFSKEILKSNGGIPVFQTGNNPEVGFILSNSILPIIREKKNFSKGDSKTWAKKLSKELIDFKKTEYYHSLEKIIQFEINFKMRNI